jgi:Domain of unknown function (DUF4253)
MNSNQRQLAIMHLTTVTNEPVRSFFTVDFGREENSNCISALVPEQQSGEFLSQIRELLEPGFVAFIGTTFSLAPDRPPGLVELVVGLGKSQFDILRLAATDAVNYDMLTEDIIEKLTDIDRRFGIDIVQAGTDTLAFKLLSSPEDISAFAQEIYDFCPDIVDQGVETVEALSEGIAITGYVPLWWD